MKQFGSTLTFEFYLKTMHGAIIEGFRKYLSSIQPEDIRAMVKEDRFPPLEHLDLWGVSDNAEHLERITSDRLIDFIAEARPDLITVIQDMGVQGGKYIIKLRLHILGLLKHAEFKPEENVVLAHCDKCGKKWPVKKDEASSITKCPFCGAGEDEPKEPPAEDE